MNEDVRIALLQEILAGIIERGRIAPLPEGATDGVPLQLTMLPAAAGSTLPAMALPSRIGESSK